ncbi:hypothetical protein A2897_00340 [Candidatus Woesebacteria bacterium RIFCSPLOWO2_01_FULL_44_24b]|nr:MAG: hypothetical protein A2897_00340 [Candidatus Woesebacteria bacterium RIFCSPLOWO2_01_FULL_44_24b]
MTVAFHLLVAIVVPVLVLVLVKNKYRFYIFTSSLVFIYLSVKTLGLSLADLGIKKEQIATSWSIGFFFFVTVLVFLIFNLDRKNINKLKVNHLSKSLNPWQYVLIGIPVQQLICFGYTFALLSTITNSPLVIAMVSGTLFGLMHVPFRNTYLFVATLLVGLISGYFYANSSNLFVGIFYHEVVGISLLKRLEM